MQSWKGAPGVAGNGKRLMSAEGQKRMGNPAKNKSQEHAENGQIQGLGSRASEEGILQWTGSLEAGLQSALCQAPRRRAKEPQAPSLSPGSVASSWKDEAELSSNTESSVSSSLGRGRGPG